MKLSDKGWHKIVVAENLLDDPEFDQSDFEGAVVLTVEEANILLTMVDDFPELSVANRLIKRLQERIEQAEKENADN